jgi:hypothetical protein
LDLNLHFTELDWERIGRDWPAWWSGELEPPLIVLECIEAELAGTPHYASTFLGNYSLDSNFDELLDRFVPRLEATYYLGDAFPY